ncbi:MAG: HD domain-containing protein [Clostridiales bacterium]|jgi:tRNA nucleotidyltransferase (CCA-adding enzyme)|nr:HD domain-containing protein [Clostridiales bacterium]
MREVSAARRERFRQTLPTSVLKIAELLPLYVVGGFTRNFFMEAQGSTDIDIAGPLSSAEVKKLVGYPVTVVSERLDTSVIAAPEGKLEYTPFRSESYAPGGGHTPERVSFGAGLFEDSRRRDFSCNTVYYDISRGEFIDLHNGVGDIGNKILRAVPEPERVFASDGLRLMRLARLAAETGFAIDPETFRVAAARAAQLGDISKERKAQELNRILNADRVYGVEDAHYRGLKLLGELGLWRYVIPELEAGMGIGQNPKYHKFDVYEHSLQTVKFAPADIRLAALLHDIAKPLCLKRDGNMHNHAADGAVMTRNILTRLGYPNAVRARTARLVALHMFDLAHNTRPNKLRCFVAENSDIIGELAELIVADGYATGFPYVRNERLTDTLRRMREEGTPLSIGGLAVSGTDLTSAGILDKLIGRVLKELLNEVICGNLANEKGALTRRAARLAKSL